MRDSDRSTDRPFETIARWYVASLRPPAHGLKQHLAERRTIAEVLARRRYLEIALASPRRSSVADRPRGTSLREPRSRAAIAQDLRARSRAVSGTRQVAARSDCCRSRGNLRTRAGSGNPRGRKPETRRRNPCRGVNGLNRRPSGYSRERLRRRDGAPRRRGHSRAPSSSACCPAHCLRSDARAVSYARTWGAHRRRPT